jgi:aminoglycoside phosphotransferase (APT) family kinase protein
MRCAGTEPPDSPSSRTDRRLMDSSIFAARAAMYLREAWNKPFLEVTDARRIIGGASRLTWSVDVRWSEDDGTVQDRELIFRLDPPASLLESNRGTEYAMYRALYGAPGIPLPEPLLIEDGDDAFGMPFFVMQRLGGAAWPQELLTPSFAGRGELIIREMFRVLGAISAMDYEAVGLGGVLHPPSVDDAWSFELERWEKTLRDHDLGPMPVTRAVVRELRRNPPPPISHLQIVHGDFRVGNVLFSPEGIVGVLDWELTHLGDPHEDIAWSMARNWRSATTPGMIGGAIDPAEAVAEWETTSGMRADPASLQWWRLFSHVKATAIWATAAHEFSTGRTRELMFGTMGWLNIGSQEKWALEDLGVMTP